MGVSIAIAVALVLCRAPCARAQRGGSGDSARVAALEQRVEDAVVGRRLAVLDSVYSPDFRFKHSTGEAETRGEWLAAVRRSRYASRRIDSLDVELHGDIALTTGRLHVRRAPDDPDWSAAPEWRDYTIRYARVYVRRSGRWSMLTHHSTGQTFGPPNGRVGSVPPAG